MGFKLRKSPGKELYWVVGEDNKHFSKNPIPKVDAKAQLRALYAAEGRKGGSEFQDAYNGGGVSTSKVIREHDAALKKLRLGNGRGGDRFGRGVPAVDLLTMSEQTYALSNGGKPKDVGEWKVLDSSPTLVLYGDGRNYVLAVRGTKEFKDVMAWFPVYIGWVSWTDRFKGDLAQAKEWKKRFPVPWLGTGHSLGAAVLDNLMEAGLVGNSMTFNPAVEEQFSSNANRRVYFQGDPLLTLVGNRDMRRVVVSDPSPNWAKVELGSDLLLALKQNTLETLKKHKLESFETNPSGLGADVGQGGAYSDLTKKTLKATELRKQIKSLMDEYEDNNPSNEQWAKMTGRQRDEVSDVLDGIHYEFKQVQAELRAFMGKEFEGEIGIPRRRRRVVVHPKSPLSGKGADVDLEALAESLSGGGGEHSAFPYSSPNLTSAEKAKERAKHYRDVKRELRKLGTKATFTKVEGEKKAVEKASPEKKLLTVRGTLLEVKGLPAEVGEKVAVRGVKSSKPKKAPTGVRKPYVGKKMKEVFMAAHGNNRNLFNQAKRLYKAGGVSWDDVIKTSGTLKTNSV